MARKVEPALVEINRNRIVQVAKELFMTKGFAATTMADVAKATNISKSTLYVYFKCKEDIQNYLALEAMTFLYEQLSARIQTENATFKERYMQFCNTLVEMKEKYPLSFQIIVDEIPVDEVSLAENAVLRETYEVGEKINALVRHVFETAGYMAKGSALLSSSFVMWGSIYGLITLAENKQVYINKSMHISKQEFLQNGFEQLFKAVYQEVSL